MPRKAGYRRKIQHETIYRDLAAQRHGDEHGICRTVTNEDDAEIGQAREKLAHSQALLPCNTFVKKPEKDRPQPIVHTVNADILCGGKIRGARRNVVELFFDIGTLGARAVFVVLIRADAEPVDNGHHRQKQHEPRAGKRYHGINRFAPYSGQDVRRRH